MCGVPSSMNIQLGPGFQQMLDQQMELDRQQEMVDEQLVMVPPLRSVVRARVHHRLSKFVESLLVDARLVKEVDTVPTPAPLHTMIIIDEWQNEDGTVEHRTRTEPVPTPIPDPLDIAGSWSPIGQHEFVLIGGR